MDHSAADGRVVDGDAALSHHLFQISEADAVGQIPPHAQRDHRAIKVAAFEHRATPELAGGISRTELPMDLRQCHQHLASPLLKTGDELAKGTLLRLRQHVDMFRTTQMAMYALTSSSHDILSIFTWV